MRCRAYGEATSFASDHAATSDGSPGDRCTFQAHEGRCCLRGGIGSWGKMFCRFHYFVVEAGTPHTKAEFAAMVNQDRENGYTGWDLRPFDEWWDHVIGRAPFPVNPKTRLQAAEDRIRLEKEAAKDDLDPIRDRELQEAGIAAIRLAEAFRPRLAG